MDRLAASLGTAFSIEGEIGRGGMGVVYRARDERLKRPVAIKLLPPELAFREDIKTRFLREAETAARLSHPHIVPIYTVGESDGLVYFIMAFVDGESLGGKLRRRGRLPSEEVRRVMKETADALSCAHGVGIIHRDVKPDNILLEGARGRVMVTDFGIAKALTEIGSASLTGTGVAIGTPAYMSPEQAAGERDLDGRSDVYSLGVVAFQSITGELPFSAPTVPKLLYKQITEQAPLVSTKRRDVPSDLGAAIQRALEKEPEDRWPTADALRRALEHRSAVPYQPRVPARAARRSRRPERPVRDRSLESAWSGVEHRGQPREGLPARRGSRYAPAAPREPEAGEPVVVTKFRGRFASWASVSGGLMLLNIAMQSEPWFLFVALPWAGFGLLPAYMRLWQQGYSWRDVLRRPPAPDALEARERKSGAAQLAPPATADEFGLATPRIRQAHSDRQAIAQMVERLPSADRQMLPEILPTADSLLSRASDLARTLHHMEVDVDAAKLDELEVRIERLRDRADRPEIARQLDLLERQRVSLGELVGRRDKVESQLESCLLALQNLRFDLLRLRSAGVAAVLDDLTHATQQARALAVDVDAVISAAREVRETLRR
jgi:serine/threonine-protein kinase